MPRIKPNYTEYAAHYEAIIPGCKDRKHKALLKSVLKEIIKPNVK